MGRVDDRVGFEVERTPSRRPIRWRLPAFLGLLLVFGVAYQALHPTLLIGGQYDGYIGSEYSNAKQHLEMRLAQQGREVHGDCIISHNRGRVLIRQTARLQGTVSGSGFKVKGQLKDERGELKGTVFVVFEGGYSRTGGGQIAGRVYNQEAGRTTFSTTFLGRFKSAFSPKDLVQP